MTAVDLLVIGGGPAGHKAAIQGAKAGRRVLLVEDGADVGGACVERGTIPSKTLRETAMALAGFRRRTGDVLRVALPEHVQVASLMTRKEQVIAAHTRVMADQLARNGVERWHGRARFVGPHEIVVAGPDGSRRSARGDVVVIATGSRPRTPPEVPVDHEQVLDSDSILALTYLPASLTVLGAGVIACEYASIFAALGVRVTMIDRGARPVPFLDPEITSRFVAAFERAGGIWLGERTLERVSVEGAFVEAHLRGGELVTSEKLLCALGRVANIDRLDLGEAGVTVGPRGLIAVDAEGRTNVPHIYAAGDVIGAPSLASAAMEQGRRAARHALGIDVTEPRSALPAGVYTIPEMASVGLSEGEARERGGGATVGLARWNELARGQIAGAEDGLLKLVADAAGRRLLGVQIVGEGAAELVHVGQMAILAGLDVDVFIDNVFNFPTLAEAYRVAALDLVGRRDRG